MNAPSGVIGPSPRPGCARRSGSRRGNELQGKGCPVSGENCAIKNSEWSFEPMNERLAKAEAVFHDALELPADQREAFLQKACGDDAELRREVAGLLQASGIADERLKDSDCAGAKAPGAV